jgi:hypothetical protein
MKSIAQKQQQQHHRHLDLAVKEREEEKGMKQQCSIIVEFKRTSQHPTPRSQQSQQVLINN